MDTLHDQLALLQQEAAEKDARLAAAARFEAGVGQQVQVLQDHINWLAAVVPPTTDPRPILTSLARSLPTFLPTPSPNPTPASAHSHPRRPSLLDLPDTALASIARAAGPIARATCTALRTAPGPLTHIRPYQAPDLPATSPPLPPSTLLAPVTSLDLSLLSPTRDPTPTPILAAAAAHCTALHALTLPPARPLDDGPHGHRPLSSFLPTAPFTALRTLSSPECRLDYPDDLAPLSLLTSLRSLSLQATINVTRPIGDHATTIAAALAPVLTLSRLTLLDLHCQAMSRNSSFSFEEFQDRATDITGHIATTLLDALPTALPHLVELSIDHCPPVTNLRMLSRLAPMSALRALFVSHPSCSPSENADPAMFQPLVALPHLTSLSVTLPVTMLSRFPRRASAPPLRALKLICMEPQHTVGQPDDSCCHLLDALVTPALTYLCMDQDAVRRHLRFEIDVAPLLAAAAPSLRSLGLNSFDVPAELVTAIAGLPHLTQLLVWNCTLDCLQGLSQLTQLQDLCLATGDHHPRGCVPQPGLLAAAGHLTRLTRLRVHSHGVREEQVWHLLPLQRLQTLALSGDSLERRLTIASPTVLALLLHLRALRWLNWQHASVDELWHVDDVRRLAKEAVAEHHRPAAAKKVKQKLYPRPRPAAAHPGCAFM